MQNIKKITLFLFGVILIIWGYKVNAANNTAKAEEEKATKETEVLPVTPPEKQEVKAEDPKEPKDSIPQKTKKEASPNTPAKSKKEPAKPVVKKETENKTTQEPKTVEEPKQTVIEKATPEEATGTE